MAPRYGSRNRLGPFIALAGLVGLIGATLAAPPNEREVKDENPVIATEAAKGGKIWVLDFKFKDPRLIKVNIPGRGEKLCWYVWYQVVNRTGEPRTFVPDFELVTHDTRMTYRDQILPAAQAEIAKVEDPSNFYKAKNSVTIAADPIPPSLPKATPRVVTGVAIWTDPNEIDPLDDEATKERKKKMPKLVDSNKYSIFVMGLSSGWSRTDPIPPSTKPVIRRKTLQLTFQRLGTKYLMKSEDIRFVPPVQWIYRASESDFRPADKEKAATKTPDKAPPEKTPDKAPPEKAPPDKAPPDKTPPDDAVSDKTAPVALPPIALPPVGAPPVGTLPLSVPPVGAGPVALPPVALPPVKRP